MKKLSKLRIKNYELSQIRGGTTYWVTGYRGDEHGNTFWDCALVGGAGYGSTTYEWYLVNQWCDIPDNTPGVFPTVGEECDSPHGMGGYQQY
jgi:hypothetical protein